MQIKTGFLLAVRDPTRADLPQEPDLAPADAPVQAPIADIQAFDLETSELRRPNDAAAQCGCADAPPFSGAAIAIVAGQNLCRRCYWRVYQQQKINADP